MPTSRKSNKTARRKTKSRMELIAEQMTQLQQEITKLQRKSGVLCTTVDVVVIWPLFTGSKKKIRQAFNSAPKPKKLIPKPPGAAGKRNGYNLQEAMGLKDNKRLYNAQMVHICSYMRAI